MCNRKTSEFEERLKLVFIILKNKILPIYNLKVYVSFRKCND